MLICGEIAVGTTPSEGRSRVYHDCASDGFELKLLKIIVLGLLTTW